MNLGLQLAESEFLSYMENIIEQMKKKDYIKSTYWTIEYNEKKYTMNIIKILMLF